MVLVLVLGLNKSGLSKASSSAIIASSKFVFILGSARSRSDKSCVEPSGIVVEYIFSSILSSVSTSSYKPKPLKPSLGSPPPLKTFLVYTDFSLGLGISPICTASGYCCLKASILPTCTCCSLPSAN